MAKETGIGIVVVLVGRICIRGTVGNISVFSIWLGLATTGSIEAIGKESYLARTSSKTFLWPDSIWPYELAKNAQNI